MQSPIQEDALLVFLNAKSKDSVDDVFVNVFRFRRDVIPQRKLDEWKAGFDLTSDEQVSALVKSTGALIRECLYSSSLPAQVLSPGFHAQLAGLFAKVIRAHGEEWRAAISTNTVSPPQLLEFDYRVDTTASSDALSRMNASSLLLALKIQQTPTRVGVMPGVRDVQVELSEQELQTMLDGLGKIKDQLESIKQ